MLQCIQSKREQPIRWQILCQQLPRMSMGGCGGAIGSEVLIRLLILHLPGCPPSLLFPNAMTNLSACATAANTCRSASSHVPTPPSLPQHVAPVSIKRANRTHVRTKCRTLCRSQCDRIYAVYQLRIASFMLSSGSQLMSPSLLLPSPAAALNTSQVVAVPEHYLERKIFLSSMRGESRDN